MLIGDGIDYMNLFYSSYLPILSSAVFDNTGKEYDVSKILGKNFRFDEEAYKSYSKVYMPITYVLSYGLQFAALTALITHTACWHGRDIWNQGKKVFQSSPSTSTSTSNSTSTYTPLNPTSRRHRRRDRRLSSTDDVHTRLMSSYPDCPNTYYFLLFLLLLPISLFTITHYPTSLPPLGLLLSLSIPTLLFIPIGIIMAITNTQSSLFLICQLTAGYLYPGRPIANMIFVTYGYITSTQGLKFASDLKLGHYMKLPPRLLFTLQLVATIVGGLTQVGVLNWMFANIPHICTDAALNGFTCPIARVHFNGSILWGVIGPQRFFGSGQLYRPLIWAFPLGLVLPPCLYYVWRRRGADPSSILRKVSLPVVFGSLSWIPPATGLNFSAWALVCWFFNKWVKGRKEGWWGKYTMTLSAGLDAGLAVGMGVVFFGVLWPQWGWWQGMEEGGGWWGMRVFKEGCDWRGCRWRDVSELPGGKFGQ